MFKRKFSHTNVFVPTDNLPEVAALVNKHKSLHNKNGYNWEVGLAKDLLNYISRPDFLVEAIHYIRSMDIGILYRITVIFLENITDAQIKLLLEDPLGTNFISEIENWMSLSGDPFGGIRGADQNKLSQLFTKIQRVRIPIIANDKRPYVGDMVGADENMGIDPSISPIPRLSFGSYRFGGNHDGEHWLTKTVGAQVKATTEINGTVLTRYKQSAEQGKAQLFNVMILLDNTNAVMIIKDLVTIGPKITATRATSPDDKKTKHVDESKFTKSNGEPKSEIKLVNGDIIGTTTHWDPSAASFYPEYNKVFGTFHFSFIKYEFVQQYRTLKGAATRDGLHADLDITIPDLTKDILGNVNYPGHWFIPPCSPESPVRCFK